MPRLQVTVPQEVYDAVAADCGEPFADSYLSGAVVRGPDLTPHTVTAWQALKRHGHAKAAIQRLKLNLVEPMPYGHPGRNGT